MPFIKKNISLLLALAIPVAMVLFVAASIYLPSMFIQPHFNFVYVVGDNDYRGMHFSAENGTIVYHDLPANGQTVPPPMPKLYLYDVTTNKSTEIPPEQQQAYHLDDSPTSPDGFKITYGSRGDSFLFFFGSGGTDYSSQYLVGNGVSKKLNIKADAQYYNNNFRLLGWVK